MGSQHKEHILSTSWQAQSSQSYFEGQFKLDVDAPFAQQGSSASPLPWPD